MMTRIVCLLLLCLAFGGCSDARHEDEHGENTGVVHDDHGGQATPVGRGPNGGRLLTDGDFTVELTIFEENIAPEFRLYVTQAGRPITPAAVEATVELTRLNGAVDRFSFAPESDYLRGSQPVAEPHSFDVKVAVKHSGKAYEWPYESYEGRTTIPAALAVEAGIEVQPAGKAVIRDNVHLVGTVMLNADRHAHIEARFPGTVRAVRVHQGDRVRRGQTLLVIEANESMREYPVTAPFDGVVLARNTNVGDLAGDNTLLEIADLSEVWVELHAIGEAATRIAAGQPVRITAATGGATAASTVSVVLPLATRGQTVIVRARVPNKDGAWRPGMTVEADIAVAEREVPLAVREAALQRFRDFTVVFARVGDTYEVRMLELGARDGEFAEVLSGLEPGTLYVTAQSFLIKADIEKSGAAHDH